MAWRLLPFGGCQIPKVKVSLGFAQTVLILSIRKHLLYFNQDFTYINKSKLSNYRFRFISVRGKLIDALEDITEPRRISGDGSADCRLFGVCTLPRLPFDFTGVGEMPY